MKLIFAVSDVSFNSGHYIVIIKRQFLYINYTVEMTYAGVPVTLTLTIDVLLWQIPYSLEKDSGTPLDRIECMRCSLLRSMISGVCQPVCYAASLCKHG